MTYSGRTGNTFVGRQREMGERTSALEDAMSGHGRLVLLAGEPGVGKTRTAQGRVMSIFRITKQSLPLGWLLGGVLSTVLGNVPTLALCASLFMGLNLLARP